MKKLWIKYKSFVLYVIFGVFTTIVNIVCYRLCKEIGGKSTFFLTPLLGLWLHYLHTSPTENGCLAVKSISFMRLSER